MTDDSLIHDALSVGLVEVRGSEVWRVATRTRTGRVRHLLAPTRADGIDPSTGYRRVRLGKYGSALGHRIVWIAANGPIPEGLEVNHRNRDKSDNSVDNLELTTHPENVQHAFATGIKSARGEANGQSKLTADQVTAIRRRAADGVAKRALAREYKVTPTLVRSIVSGEGWAHLGFPEPRP